MRFCQLSNQCRALWWCQKGSVRVTSDAECREHIMFDFWHYLTLQKKELEPTLVKNGRHWCCTRADIAVQGHISWSVMFETISLCWITVKFFSFFYPLGCQLSETPSILLVLSNGDCFLCRWSHCALITVARIWLLPAVMSGMVCYYVTDTLITFYNNRINDN